MSFTGQRSDFGYIFVFEADRYEWPNQTRLDLLHGEQDQVSVLPCPHCISVCQVFLYELRYRVLRVWASAPFSNTKKLCNVKRGQVVRGTRIAVAQYVVAFWKDRRRGEILRNVWTGLGFADFVAGAFVVSVVGGKRSQRRHTACKKQRQNCHLQGHVERKCVTNKYVIWATLVCFCGVDHQCLAQPSGKALKNRNYPPRGLIGMAELLLPVLGMYFTCFVHICFHFLFAAMHSAKKARYTLGRKASAR